MKYGIQYTLIGTGLEYLATATSSGAPHKHAAFLGMRLAWPATFRRPYLADYGTARHHALKLFSSTIKQGHHAGELTTTLYHERCVKIVPEKVAWLLTKQFSEYWSGRLGIHLELAKVGGQSIPVYYLKDDSKPTFEQLGEKYPFLDCE